MESLSRQLDDLAQEGELDAELVRAASWLADWEDIVLGDDEREGWRREGTSVTACCDRAELERILSAMDRTETDPTATSPTEHAREGSGRAPGGRPSRPRPPCSAEGTDPRRASSGRCGRSERPLA
ncbi:MAG: hypothetical protein K8H88_09755 [Sandaracinaceae bacterium]|nr:hypothetical protein [Sandaracinaceae bacterium]